MMTPNTSTLHRLAAPWMALLVACFALGMLSPATAAAQDKVEIGVRAILASPEAGAADPELADLQATLVKAFEGYGTFKELSDEKAALALQKTQKFALPDGTAFEVAFKGTTGDLLKLGLSVGDKFKSDVRVSRGSTFFQAGLPYNKGILIIAITAR